MPGKGGEKRGANTAVRHLCNRSGESRFGFRNDVESFPASIDHGVLLALVRDHINCPCVMDLIGQYLHPTVETGAKYNTVTGGISLGCPHSHVMAAIYLQPLDRRLEAAGLAYARLPDDWVVLAPKRWALRRAIVLVTETLRALRVQQDSGKTSMGRIVCGFTFLGYWIIRRGLTAVAP